MDQQLKSICYSSRKATLSSWHPYSSSHLFIILVPEILTPSSGPHEYQVCHSARMYIQANTLRYKIKENFQAKYKVSCVINIV